jgi:hypothetical protein
MCTYELLAGWSAEYLHAVVAGTKEKRTEDVDNQMYPNIQTSRLLALSTVYGTVTALSSTSKENVICHNNIEQAH